MSLAEIARRTLVVLALVALAAFLWKIAPVLMLAFGGIVLATVVRAASGPVSRWLHVPRGAAVAVVVVAAIVLLGGALYFFGRNIASEAEALKDAFVGAYAAFEARFKDTPAMARLMEGVRGATSPATLAGFAKGTVTVFGALADFALLIFLAVYLAADPARYRDGVLRLLPINARAKVGEALDAAGESLRRWLVGQLLAMAMVGIAIGTALWVVGVPLAPALGVLSGLLEFIPVVGPIAGAIPGILIAFSKGLDTAIYATLVYAVVLFIEGNVVIPFAQRWAVELPPVLALLGIVVFGLLFGIVGVVFAIPLVVVLMTLVRKLYVERIEAH